MKALLINGSPHEKGCTYTALRELADTLEAEGIETEIVQAGKTAHACNACASCKKAHRCVYDLVIGAQNVPQKVYDQCVLPYQLRIHGKSPFLCLSVHACCSACAASFAFSSSSSTR